MTDDIIIKVRNLHKAFGNNKVLDGIDLDIKKDSSLVILGGSGSGKSVLIKTIIGLLNPDIGSVMVNGVETVSMNHSERLSILQNCGFLFQGGALFDSLNVIDNITFFAQKLYSLSKKDQKENKKITIEINEKIENRRI